MEIKFTPQAIKDIEFWKKSGNNKIQNKITSLLKSIKQTTTHQLDKTKLKVFKSSKLEGKSKIVLST